jgi:hypothetical protein
VKRRLFGGMPLSWESTFTWGTSYIKEDEIENR